MENDDTNNKQTETSDNLSSGSPTVVTNKQTYRANNPNKKPDHKKKKWSLLRHWRQANWPKRLRWIAAGIGVLTGVSVVTIYVWDHFQRERQFSAEHRPKVIISRPPAFVNSSFDCAVTENAIHLHTGPMQFWVKNIRQEDAVGAFISEPFMLVADKKVGNPFLDEVPEVTDKTCRAETSPKAKAFPVHGFEEVVENMTESAETFSLVKTKNLTVTLDGPQTEPQPPAGEKVERTAVSKETVFKLYVPVCVYYFDSDGVRYGSCRTYRLSVNKNAADNYAFSCTQTPISGTFEEMLFRYCEQ
jgi:hypothetical protein